MFEALQMTMLTFDTMSPRAQARAWKFCFIQIFIAWRNSSHNRVLCYHAIIRYVSVVSKRRARISQIADSKCHDVNVELLETFI
jgi:hypothetical protein